MYSMLSANMSSWECGHKIDGDENGYRTRIWAEGGINDIQKFDRRKRKEDIDKTICDKGIAELQ
jgi:hypothetical protein